MPGDRSPSQPLWQPPVSEGDEEVYRRAGYVPAALDKRIGVRPVLIVIDMVRHFLGDGIGSLEESQSRYPYSCGPAGWKALTRIAELIASCRALQVPIIYTVVRWTRAELGQMSVSNLRTNEWIDDQATLATFPEAIAPATQDIVIEKRRPSAFFGTPLAAYLISLQADSLVLTGNTTSGCVRATAVDAYSYGYGVVVAADGVFDRVDISHRVSLFDLHHKYACVAPTADIRRRLDSLPNRKRSPIEDLESEAR
jgi:nicotinamidase-related amidase